MARLRLPGGEVLVRAAQASRTELQNVGGAAATVVPRTYRPLRSAWTLPGYRGADAAAAVKIVETERKSDPRWRRIN